MNRFIAGKIVKCLFHLHYDVRIKGMDLFQDDDTFLVLPNHSAYVDPLILLSELWRFPIRPMADELFMRHWLYGPVLRIAGAIEVPDLYKSSMSREEGVSAASQLSQIAISRLREGDDICFYPSGHIKTIDKEVIGNRRMAYEVCRALPEGVRVILCRMRGLESSRWSKLKPKQRKWRRTVTLLFEDHTDDVRQWAQTLDRRTFNQRLEEWYNNY